MAGREKKRHGGLIGVRVILAPMEGLADDAARAAELKPFGIDLNFGRPEFV